MIYSNSSFVYALLESQNAFHNEKAELSCKNESTCTHTHTIGLNVGRY